MQNGQTNRSFFASVEPDGLVRAEYQDNAEVLQDENHEANNNVRYAVLYWTSSPPDNSIYLALAYSVSDFVEGGGQSGVEITVDDDLCCIVHADGTVTDLNDNLFNVDDRAYREITDNVEDELHCEIRVGIKYGLDHAITVGLRIFDCSGIPSNYYSKVVYVPPQPAATQAPAVTTTKPPKTTTEKTTKEKITTQKASASTQADTDTTASTTREPKPIITAATKAEPSATTVPQTSETLPRENAKSTTTQPKSTRSVKPKKTKAKVKRAVKTATTVTEQPASVSELAEVVSVSETTAPATASASVEETTMTTAERFRTASNIKLVGSVLAAVLLTSALFITIFSAMHAERAHTNDPTAPPEQPEDGESDSESEE